MSEKVCRRCRWQRDGECFAPRNFVRSTADEKVAKLTGLVPYEPQRKWNYCTTQRQLGPIWAWWTNKCGPQGRWFEPQP